MQFLSVCSGIEAASVAWHPLGWRAAAFSEIEKFPSAVLNHHYPDVPNLGDMTKYKDWPDAAINLLVGGTPCQSFSIAGLRAGLADPRGNLALTYLGIADRYRPEWLVWENVPGVLSADGGRAFGSILGGMAKLGYGWAYRVLDAQYVRVDGFGRAVPQRRRRVFVVGNLRDWRRAAAVLFESESLSGDTAPRRQAGERTSADVAPSLVSSGRGVERTGETRGQDPVIAVAQVAPTLNAHFGKKQGLENQHIDQGGVCSSPPVSLYLTAGGMGRLDSETETLLPINRGGFFDNGVAHSLRAEGFDASEDGTGRSTPLVPIAFSLIDDGGDHQSYVTPTLRKGGDGAFGQGMAVAFQPRIGRNGRGYSEGVALALTGADAGATSDMRPCIAIQERAISENIEAGPQGKGYQDDLAYTLEARNKAQSVATSWAVRRLIPEECERLQGFKPGYTNIPWRGKNGSPDGTRYKALGNSMAVNVMRWIGKRIEMVNATSSHQGKLNGNQS